MTPERRLRRIKSRMDGATEHPLSRRLSFRPRISSARLFAARHRVLLAVVALAIIGGGGAARALLGSGSSYAATRPIGAALVKSPLVGAGSTYRRHQVLVQIGVPTILHFVPGATFAIAVIVTNKAGAPITLARTRAVLSRRSPLRQIGTRLIAYKPPVCPPNAHCPFYDPIGNPPYSTAERPVPLTVAPGHTALAQLHFRFNPCTPKSADQCPLRRASSSCTAPQTAPSSTSASLSATRHRSSRTYLLPGSAAAKASRSPGPVFRNDP
jgi:hypothetical protein